MDLMLRSNYNQRLKVTLALQIFMCIENDDQPLLLIEVKKYEVNTLLSIESNTTAQVLRVQIVFAQGKCEKISFILTNFSIWSFGEAQKVCGNRVKVNSFSQILVNDYNAYDVVVQKIKSSLS